jgi:hypothetical protein
VFEIEVPNFSEELVTDLKMKIYEKCKMNPFQQTLTIVIKGVVVNLQDEDLLAIYGINEESLILLDNS